ncbi:MAG: glutamate racemase [Bacteroidetes bacterium SW_11_45_7]|nr:MAG: glutamate racemase [Bacteroidetes bacterium SW_11_45_7]
MALSPHQPIGIFDSGIGGLTVAKAITRLLPEEEMIYFGDTAHLPYGDKSSDAVHHFASHITRFLLDKQCKLIVIACNTASSVAYDVLQFQHGETVLMVNVIDPIVEGVTDKKQHKDIGIIGTQGTIGSGIYENKIREIDPEIRVHNLATPLLAPMIEAGFFHNKISKEIIDSYLAQPKLEDIEALILACTHYPLIKEDIEEYYQGMVDVYDSTDFVAQEVKRLLKNRELLNNFKSNDHHFYVSDYTDAFEQTTHYYYQEKIGLELCPHWSQVEEFPGNEKESL